MKIEILDEPEIASLREELRRIRGRVTLATALHPYPKISHENANAILKDFVQHLFGQNIAFEKLPMLTTEEAYREASDWLGRDMAYGGPKFEIMTDQQAAGFLARLFERFQNPWFFTNRLEDNSWYCFTKSTFDSALLVVDKQKAGLLVVEDED